MMTNKVIRNRNLDKLMVAYPRLAEKVNSQWGSRACRIMLIELLRDTRDGTRQGFDPEIAQVIFRLLADHDDAFPQYDDTEDSPLPFNGKHRPVKSRVVYTSVGYEVVQRYSTYAALFLLGLGVLKVAMKLGFI